MEQSWKTSQKEHWSFWKTFAVMIIVFSFLFSRFWELGWQVPFHSRWPRQFRVFSCCDHSVGGISSKDTKLWKLASNRPANQFYRRLQLKKEKKSRLVSLLKSSYLSRSTHRTTNFTNPEFQFPPKKVLQSVFIF